MYMKNPEAGHLAVIYGPMFSEKSGELIHRLEMAKTYRGKNVVAFKPGSDTRSDGVIKSRLGGEMPAITVTSFTEKEVRTASSYDIIGIDEAQLFDDSVITFVKRLLGLKKTVYVAGLQLDYKGLPFGHMPELIAEADELVPMHAYCTVCGASANFSQRVIDGEVVTDDGPTVLIGDSESYQPRCREHFVRKIPEF